MPTSLNLGLQERSSNFIKHLNLFHDHILIIIILNSIIVFYWVTTHVLSNKTWTNKYECNELEVFWTSIPIILLIFIALPSILILYITEETQNPTLTLKATRNQWYWTYNYPELKNLTYDRFIKKNRPPRLLSVNNRILLPSNKWIRLITTRNDVIHSWAIPSIGIKIDSIPGRLNATLIKIKRSGFITGQCSELCGINHRFIPIIIQSINPKTFFLNSKNL